MEIIFEGFPEEVQVGTSLLDLVTAKNEDTPDLMAEVNHRYIHRQDYATTILRPGDKVEFIHAAFGG